MGRISNKLLTTLYSAPLAPELWPEALAGISSSLGLNACAILHTDLSGNNNSVYFSDGVDPEVEKLYAAEYGSKDVYRPRFLRLCGNEERILMGDELCSFASLKNTAFGQDILRRAKIRLWCALSTVKSEKVVENISLYHPWDSDPPHPEQLADVKVLLPHLSNALRLRARLFKLEGLTQNLYRALDLADCAVVLFDEAGRCLFLNRMAERVVKRRNGLAFANGRLGASDPGEASALANLVRGATACGGRHEVTGGMVRISQNGEDRCTFASLHFPVTAVRMELASQPSACWAIRTKAQTCRLSCCRRPMD